MPKLHQIVALAEGKKTRAQTTITKVYRDVQKSTGDSSPYTGFEKTYQPLDEVNGDKYPNESKRVQARVQESLKEAIDTWTDLWDTLLTQDIANQNATSNITVEGATLALEIPVTHLMWLEKQLTEVANVIEKLPTLDNAHEWEYSKQADAYVTPPIQTIKTKKIPVPLVKAPATDKHPAQVEVYNEDRTVGHWTTRHFSGAIEAKAKREYLERVRKLQEAVKVARTKANDIDAKEVKQAQGLLNYIFGVQS